MDNRKNEKKATPAEKAVPEKKSLPEKKPLLKQLPVKKTGKEEDTSYGKREESPPRHSDKSEVTEYDEAWPYTTLGSVFPAMRQGTPYHTLVQQARKANAERGENEFTFFQAKDSGALLATLLRVPFPPQKGYQEAYGRGWTYVEVATRLRLLFTALFASANAAADDRIKSMRAAPRVQDAKGKAEELPSSKQQPKDHDVKGEAEKLPSIKPQPKDKEKTEKLVSSKPQPKNPAFKEKGPQQQPKPAEKALPKEQKILLNNQLLIDAAIRQNQNPEACGFRVEEPGIEWPRYAGELRSKGEGPIGPVSLEVAFILGLQLAGLDLAAMSLSRRNAVKAGVLEAIGALTPPPKVYTCASFSEGKDCEQKWFASDTQHATSREPHTTVRTRQKFEFATVGTGVYVGFDLECGLGKSSLPDDRRYFAFALHAVDSSTHEQIQPLSKIKLVWPHCHQGFWQSQSSYHQMFISPGPGTHDDFIFKPDETKMPQYRQFPPTHIYLSNDPVLEPLEAHA